MWLRPEHILVLGDSHAGVFRNWRFRVAFPRTRFNLCVVGGATASGLENPNSKTKAGAQFEAALQNNTPTRIITLLGEVDTGFVIWYRAKKYEQSVDSMLDQALANYARLLASCQARAHTIVLSAPLPTIRDGQNWGEIANLRREVDASLRERTNLTLQFNARLAVIAAQHGCDFVGLDRECLGPDAFVAPAMLNNDPLNHHYRVPSYARLISGKLPHALVARHPRAAASTRSPQLTAAI